MFRSSKDYNITKKEIIKNDTLGEYYCDFCDKGPWPTEADLEIHRKYAHRWHLTKLLSDVRNYMCPLCIRQQEDQPSLIEHIKVVHLCCSPNTNHINRETFICDHCNRLFFNKSLLIAHMQHWHPAIMGTNPKTKITCPKCWKSLPDSGIWYHFVRHGLFSVTTCPICIENFNDTPQMLEHLKKHPGYFVCDICGYESSKELHYKNHLERHRKAVPFNSKGDVSRYFLPYGNTDSTWKDRLHSYFRGIPLTYFVRICILCRHLCKTEDDMRQHIYGDHAPEKETRSKVHMCVCGEEFFNSILLKQHVFKMKGDHRVWDGITPLPNSEDNDQEVVYQIFELSEPLPIEVNEIIITQLEQEGAQNENHFMIKGLEQMEEK